VFLVLSEVPGEAEETIEHGALFQIGIESVLCVVRTMLKKQLNIEHDQLLTLGINIVFSGAQLRQFV
jgi:hypothetical protein